MPSAPIKIREILIQGKQGPAAATVVRASGVPTIIEKGAAYGTRYEDVVTLIMAIAARLEHEHEEGQITRAISDEFTFYPTDKPFSMDEYELIIAETARIARRLPPDIHMVLATFAVSWPDGGVHNCGLYVQSPNGPDARPLLHHFSKKNNYRLDYQYQTKSGKILSRTTDDDCSDEQLPGVVLAGTEVSTGDINQSGSALKITTSDGRSFISTIGICLDHACGVERQAVHALIYQLQAAHELVPLYCSHVITSASISELPEHVISTMSHADPQEDMRKPTCFPKRSGCTSGHLSSAFSGQLSIELYPAKPIGLIHSDLFLHAVASCTPEVVREYLNTPDLEGNTVLHQTFLEVDIDPGLMARRLYSMILHGGDPTLVNKAGKDVLQLAEEFVSLAPAHQIVFHALNTSYFGRNLMKEQSIYFDNGRTPLTRLLSIEKPDLKEISKLIMGGANPYQKDKQGQDAFDVVAGHADMFDRLILNAHLSKCAELTQYGYRKNLLDAAPSSTSLWFIEKPEAESFTHSHIQLDHLDLIHLTEALKQISRRDRIKLIKTMKQNISDLVQSADDYWYLIARINEEERPILSAILMDKMSALIVNLSEYEKVFITLTDEQEPIFFESMKKKLPSFVSSGQELNDLLSLHDHEQRMQLLRAMEQKLPDLILSIFDYYQITADAADDDEHCFVLNALRHTLPQLITSANDMDGLLMQFDGVEPYDLVLELMIDKLPSIIRKAEDVSVVTYGSVEKRRQIFYKMESHFTSLIQSTASFNEVLGGFAEPEKVLLFQHVHDQLLGWIDSYKGLIDILAVLPAEYFAEVLTPANVQWIDSLDSYIQMLQIFSSAAQEMIFIHLLKERLATLVPSVKELTALITSLPIEVATHTLLSLKEQLPRLITSVEVFNKVIAQIKSVTGDALFIAMVEVVAQWLESSPASFDNFSTQLSDESKIQFQAMKDKLQDTEKDPTTSFRMSIETFKNESKSKSKKDSYKPS